MYDYDYYVDDVRYEQGKLFELISNNNKSLLQFIPQYFNNKLHINIDKYSPRFVTMSAEDLYAQTKDFVEEYATVDKYASWYGQFYALIHSYTMIPSTILYNLYPLSYLAENFNPDVDELIQSIIDNAHYFSEDDNVLGHNMSSMFKISGIVYNSVFQYVAYRKAYWSKNYDEAEHILKAGNNVEVQTIYKTLRNVDEMKWEKVREQTLYTGLYNCITQNSTREDQLTEYANKLLIYTGKDLYLSIGVPKLSKNLKNTDYWKGRNVWGITLMRVIATLGKQ